MSAQESELTKPVPEGINRGQSIDLQDELGAAATVDISENLPPLSKEIWYDADNMEMAAPGGSEEFFAVSGVRIGDTMANKRDNERWEALMNKLSNIENNTSSLSKDLSALTGRVEENSEQIAATKNLASTNAQKISELNRRSSASWAEMERNMEARFSAMEDAFRESNEQFRASVVKEAEHKSKEAAKEVTRDLQDEVTQEKYDARKINLLVIGIPESERDDAKEAATSFFSKRMAISKVDVDIAYRLGKAGGHKPRPILVKFKEMAHRNKVWFSKSKISREVGESKAWIQEDLPKAVKNSYRTFFRILRKAKSMRDRFPNIHIRGQSIIIEDKIYGEGDLEQLPEALRPSSLAMAQSDEALVFFGRFCPLSNHHPSPFTLGGVKFSCMEQFIAWSRATHAGKTKLAAKALKPADPIFYKGILNELKANKTNDSAKQQLADQWYSQLDEVLGRGLMAKFQQNPSLARFLCKTSPKALGEACPDTRWGIGFTLTDSRALDIGKWPAEGNAMGRQLSIIRDELLADKND